MPRKFPAVRLPLTPQSSPLRPNTNHSDDGFGLQSKDGPQRPHGNDSNKTPGRAAREPRNAPETAKEQLTRIATFLLTLPTQHTNLVIPSPHPDTLLVFAGALGYSKGRLPRYPAIATHAALYALLTPCVPDSILRITRYRQTYTPPQLTVRRMPTPAHDCIQKWIAKWLLNPRLDDSLSLALTPDEMDCVHPSFGTAVQLPGGPQDLGHTDHVAELAPEVHKVRKKPRALCKEPDVELTYRPDLDPSYKKRNAPTMELEIPAFPHIIIETGYTESYADLKADIADYLISSRGKTNLAILIYIDYADKLSPNSSDPASPQQSSPGTVSADSSPSPPPSSPDDYVRRMKDAQQPQVADKYLPQFTAFVEAWEYTPLITGTTTSGAPLHLRAPGRVYLIRNGVHEENPCIHMCREDFDMRSQTVNPTNLSPAPDTATGTTPQGAATAPPPAQPRTFHAINLSFYNMVLTDARKHMVYDDMVVTAKVQRARKRLREGDVGGDYRPYQKVVRNWDRIGKEDGNADPDGEANDGNGVGEEGEEEGMQRGGRTKRVTRSMARERQ